MRVIIYESSAQGGNFNYASQLLTAYCIDVNIEQAQLVVPVTVMPKENIVAILLRDKVNGVVILKRLYFFWRSLVNPFILFFYLRKQPSSFVLFNDFEQLTAPLWVPFFKLFLRQHCFAVFLHDPDRDAYPPAYWYSVFSMKRMMSLMKFGLFHELLPTRSYYNGNNTTYLAVPHGIYELPSPDSNLLAEINAFQAGAFTFGIVGNLRSEKNYELAIRCLKEYPGIKLVIAGSPSNSDINIKVWYNLASELGVENQILWVVRYLTEAELAAVIQVVDCILLNYSNSFTSQSGIINMLAPFRKRIIISKTSSGLTEIASRFKLGIMIEPDSSKALSAAIKEITTDLSAGIGSWNSFIDYASWQNQVAIVTKAYAAR